LFVFFWADFQPPRHAVGTVPPADRFFAVWGLCGTAGYKHSAKKKCCYRPPPRSLDAREPKKSCLFAGQRLRIASSFSHFPKIRAERPEPQTNRRLAPVVIAEGGSAKFPLHGVPPAFSNLLQLQPAKTLERRNPKRRSSEKNAVSAFRAPVCAMWGAVLSFGRGP